MQKSLAKNSIYNVIYTIANILFPFITSILVSRILLPSGVGKVASAQNIVSYFVTIAALGLPSYGVREFSKIRDNRESRDKLFTELLIVNIISTTISVIAFFILIFNADHFKKDFWLYTACGVSIFFNYINIDWMYKGLEEYGYITSRSLIIKAVSLITLILTVKTKDDFIIYALISSLAIGANYIFNVFHAHKFVKLTFKKLNFKKHIRPILLIAIIIFMSSIYNKIDITMLDMMSSDENVGYYTYAQKTVGIVLTLANAITAALLPRLSYYYENDRNSFYDLLNKGFKILCFLSFPLMIGMILVSNQVVKVLYGESFIPAAKTIRLMCPLILIKGFGDLFCYQLVYSTKSEKIILPAATIASLLNIIVNVILIPYLLQNGAVIASVISEFATNLIQFIFIRKKVKFSINFKTLVVAIITSLLMGLSVYGVMQINMNIYISLLVEVSCGMVVYLTLNLLFKNEILLDLIQTIKKFFYKK